MRYLIFTILFMLISGCKPVVDESNKPTVSIGEVPPSVEAEKPKEVLKKNVCEVVEFSVNLSGPGGKWKKTVSMPAKGKFVGECHYLTSLDSQVSGAPKSSTDGIEPHLKRECELIKAFDQSADCSKLHADKYDKCWTPSEDGDIAAGSIGLEWQRKNLTPNDEMWGMNMMWAKGAKPKPGAKFLLSKDGKFVVAYAGHETGPGSSEFLGGVSPAIHYWLGASNSSEIKIEFLKDQSLTPGPISCGEN